MLISIIANYLSDDMRINITDRISNKFGTDGMVDMVYSGGDKLFPKISFEYCKALAEEITTMIIHNK